MGRGLWLVCVLLGLFIAFSYNSRQSVALGAWFVWGIDDVATHYLTDSSVGWIFSLKQSLFERYAFMVDSVGHIEPSKVRSYLPNDYSYELVKETTLEPLVFPGLFASSPAIQKWRNMAYINQTIGDIICPVVLSNANDFEIHREAKSYTDVINTLQKDPNSSLYISGDQFVFENDKGKILLEDLEIEQKLGDKFMNSSLFSKEELYLFLGNRGKSGTSWHCAPNRSMFVQVVGRKRWTFIHPRYSLLLHPQRSHLYSRIFLAGDSFQFFHNEKQKNQGKGTTVQSDGSIFDHIPRKQVILEPGDAVTVPSWYWHHVENLPSNTTEHLIIGVDIDTKVKNHSWLYALFPSLA